MDPRHIESVYMTFTTSEPEVSEAFTLQVNETLRSKVCPASNPPNAPRPKTEG